MTSDINWNEILPPLRKPRKAVKVVPIATRYDYKALYYEARKVMFQHEYPAAWADGEYFDGKVPDITTTNGISRYIEDIINNYGHHAERVNTMGIPITVKGVTKWRISGSTKGSTDIHCIVNGKTWKIEVKKGSDDLNPAQVKYQEKMQRIGVSHTVIHVGQIDLFWDEYYKIVSL
jgi:hypothetical protein